MLIINTPTTESPSDQYSVSVYEDFFSSDQAESFSEGEVVRCHYDDALPFDSSYPVVFND